MQSTKENKSTELPAVTTPAKKVRPKRSPISMVGRNVTTVKGKEPGFHYHIFNDVGDRIENMKARGYEMVTHEVTVGDRRVGKSSEVGSSVTLNVGGGVKGVLMRIPQEWYDEDQREKLGMVDKSEEAIKGKLNPQTGSNAADYGEVSISNKA